MTSRAEFERLVEHGELGEQSEEESRRAVVLRERDRELLVQLAMARYLSKEQVGELVFPGKSSSIARRRLSLLRRAGYLRRLPLRMTDGKQAVVWGLTSLGYLAARNCFDTIQAPTFKEPSSGFLEHQLLLNRLFVSLALAAKDKKIPCIRWPFQWVPSDSAQLHWTELDQERNRPIGHLLSPDATLEVPSAKRRIFIEAEATHHALGLRSQRHHATMSKIERYAHFVVMPPSAGETAHYVRRFPDRWPAELLFVVQMPAHRDAIARWAAGGWSGTDEAQAFNVRVLTFEEASFELCRLAGLPSSQASAPPALSDGVALTDVEARALYEFYNATIASIAAVRRFAKGHSGIATLVLPEYPANHKAVKEICVRLAEGFR